MGCTRNVLALTRELAPGRRLVLTVTHAHPEHGFGAQVFKQDAEIFGTLDELGRRGVTIVAGPLEYEPIRRRGGFFADPWGNLIENHPRRLTAPAELGRRSARSGQRRRSITPKDTT